MAPDYGGQRVRGRGWEVKVVAGQREESREEPRQRPSLRVIGGMLIDGTGAEPRPAAVGIENGEIVEISSAAHKLREGDIDATGKYIVPGLINMHEHLTYRELKGPTADAIRLGPVEATIVAVRNALNALSRGWTTVVDMGAAYNIAGTVAQMIREGALYGPRILTVCQPISVTGGHASGGGLCIQADGPEECRKAARRVLAAGADLVKVMASHDPWEMPGVEQSRPEMSPEEIRAAYAEARRWGKLATCHVMGREAIANVIEAGVNIIHHGVYLDVDLAKEMARSEITYCPTASAYCRQTMNPAFERGERWGREHEVLVEPHLKSLRVAFEAGVRMVVGTDSTGSYAEEIALLRDAGMPAMDTLVASTRYAAEALHIDDEVGTVEVGKVADLVVLERDPLEDSYALQEVAYVIREGRVYLPKHLVLERCDDKKWIPRHLGGR